MSSTHTRINASEFSRVTRSLFEKFDHPETGDLLVLTGKGQQETLFGLEHVSESVAAPILRLDTCFIISRRSWLCRYSLLRMRA